MRVAALAVHPVKSTAIRPVERATVTPGGLLGDREWIVVNDFGELVSAREFPPLFSVVADNAATGLTDVDLQLTAPNIDPLRINFPVDGTDCSVRMFNRDPLLAKSAGDEADQWLDIALGTDGMHLVWCSNPTARQLDPQYTEPDDYGYFQDGYPVTLLSQESVAQLQQWMADGAQDRGEQAPSFGAERFRANILIEDVPHAYAEDEWRRVQVGSVAFRVAKRVDRCVMTTVDPQTYRKGKDPIRTLAVHRREHGKTWMAIHLLPEAEGEIAVGDEVTPLD